MAQKCVNEVKLFFIQRNLEKGDGRGERCMFKREHRRSKILVECLHNWWDKQNLGESRNSKKQAFIKREEPKLRTENHTIHSCDTEPETAPKKFLMWPKKTSCLYHERNKAAKARKGKSSKKCRVPGVSVCRLPALDRWVMQTPPRRWQQVNPPSASCLPAHHSALQDKEFCNSPWNQKTARDAALRDWKGLQQEVCPIMSESRNDQGCVLPSMVKMHCQGTSRDCPWLRLVHHKSSTSSTELSQGEE